MEWSALIWVNGIVGSSLKRSPTILGTRSFHFGGCFWLFISQIPMIYYWHKGRQLTLVYSSCILHLAILIFKNSFDKFLTIKELYTLTIKSSMWSFYFPFWSICFAVPSTLFLSLSIYLSFLSLLTQENYFQEVFTVLSYLLKTCNKSHLIVVCN